MQQIHMSTNECKEIICRLGEESKEILGITHPIRSLAQAYVYRNQCQPFAVNMDRINAVYIYDGKDTWTDESGVEWNKAVK